MRTLLDASLPPQFTGESMYSRPESATSAPRTFSPSAVLANLDDLVEVGLGDTVMATPSAGAEQAKPTLGRGVAISGTSGVHFEGAERACPNSGEVTTLTV